MCAVRRFLDRFPSFEREQLRELADDPTLSPWKVVLQFAPLQPRFSGTELIGHRNGFCDCEVEL